MVGFEVGVIFGEGNEATEVVGEGFFGTEGLGRPVRGLGGGTLAGHGLEEFAFVALVSFDALNKGGNEIVSAFQLDFDAAPSFPHLVAVFHEAIVGKNEPNDRNNDKEDQDGGEADHLRRDLDQK